MDWRNRKYYLAAPWYSYHDCIRRLKSIKTVKIHNPYDFNKDSNDFGLICPKFIVGVDKDKEDLVLAILQSSKYGLCCRPIYKEITKEMIGQ